VRERALSGPELESRLASGVLHRSAELRALLDERLVDDDEDALAGFESRGAEEVAAPGGMGEALHVA
jgi:hypothetical protein